MGTFRRLEQSWSSRWRVAFIARPGRRAAVSMATMGNLAGRLVNDL
jgi:hypothetical protein